MALLTLVLFLLAAGSEIPGKGKSWTPYFYFDYGTNITGEGNESNLAQFSRAYHTFLKTDAFKTWPQDKGWRLLAPMTITVTGFDAAGEPRSSVDYNSGLAALAGSAVGGLTSIVNMWLAQHAQTRTQQRAHEKLKQEELYGHFIDEASKLYADALQHQTEDASALVGLFALISRIRLLSSPGVTKNAEQVAQSIVETYLAPNKTFCELRDLLHQEAFDPLRAFSEACHEELRTLGSLPRRL